MKYRRTRAVLVIGAACLLGASLTAVAPAEPAPQIRGIGNAPAAETPVHGYVITKSVPGSTIPADYTFVITRDEVFVAISVRKPAGNGLFPAVLVSSGNGAGGMRTVERQTERLASMFDQMIARGYVVAYIEPRNEIPFLYGKQTRAENMPDSVSGGQRTLKSNPTLDSDDFISAIQYLQSLPYVDKDAVGAMGVSHSGELILKAASEITFACGVPIEGAANEYLEVDIGPDAPRKDNEIQFQDIDVVKRRANKAVAMERIKRIRTPLLVIGRDQDHQQGMFKLTYEWLKEAGKDVQWASFDHPVHGYPFMYRQADGSYKPDAVQQKAFDLYMAYFDKHLKRPRR
ncbi:MAG: prolyl oligopeptidase family serine peptidase [Acidobacteriota bacterium]